MIVKVKKVHPNAKLPYKASEGAVGFDVYAFSYEYDYEHKTHIYRTGICIEMPDDVECQIRPRSSIYKVDAIMTNSVGTIDPDYRGELILTFKNYNEFGIINKFLVWLGLRKPANRTPYAIGDRIGQLVFNKIERPCFVESDELSPTNRGKGGHGSTGK